MTWLLPREEAKSQQGGRERSRTRYTLRRSELRPAPRALRGGARWCSGQVAVVDAGTTESSPAHPSSTLHASPLAPTRAR